MMLNYKLTPIRSKVLEEIKKIDFRLDEEIQRVQLALQGKKMLNISLINDDLVPIYNEMLTLSYALKIWILDGLITVTDRPEELLFLAKDQFKDLLCLAGRSEKGCTKTISNLCILPYQKFHMGT
jgi:hypothetical protein